MGIIGLVLGIIGILIAIIGAVWPIGNVLTIIGLVLAAAGIVLSAVDMRKRKKNGKAVAGLILSVIALAIGIIMLVACSGTKNAIANAVGELTGNNTADDAVNNITFDLGY